jgi:hypothetical protein
MKNLILIAALTLSATVSQAKIVKSTEVLIDPANIDTVINLVNKNEPGSSQKKLNIVVTDSGMSTDLSPRYTVYLGYASMAEMGNITSTYEITNDGYGSVRAERKAAGIYTVVVTHFIDQVGFAEVTYEVNATQMFIDENKMRNACGSNFCDGNLKSQISVKQLSVKNLD